MNKAKKILWIQFFVVALILLVLDQVTKYISVLQLKDQDPVVLIPGVLEFRYLENHGAAFGMLQGQKWLLLIIGLVFLCLAGFCIMRLPEHKKYRPIYFLFAAITAGAVGNMIDRFRLDYVIDFIYFSLIDFPIFNVADIYITVSVFLLAFCILFVYKDEDFAFLELKRRKSEAEK